MPERVVVNRRSWPKQGICSNGDGVVGGCYCWLVRLLRRHPLVLGKTQAHCCLLLDTIGGIERKALASMFAILTAQMEDVGTVDEL